MPLRSLKLGVIGGGPSAFYVASRLVQLLPLTHARADDLRVHIYDRAWAPYGLVRYGVAPDHPEVKNCTHKFDETARDPRVRFFGNVHVGPRRDSSALTHGVEIPLPSLMKNYTHLLFATGAPIPRVLPHIPSAIPAINVVQWYTRDPAAPLSPPPIPANTQHLTILGLGNVTLDIARLLLTPPETLAKYDVPAHVLEWLRAMWEELRHIAIVGRRGPREARWTSKELREMFRLRDARMVPVPSGVLDEAEGQEGLTRQERRMLELLRKGSAHDGRKEFIVHFWRRAVSYGEEGLVLEDARTEERSVLRTDAVVGSLGFKVDSRLFGEWFDDERGHVRHAGSRVVTETGEVVRNVYVSGWAANGARGAIAGTVIDAKEVAGRIVDDWLSGSSGVDVGDKESVPDEVKVSEVIGWKEWEEVEREERRRGMEEGKERERMGWEQVREYLSRE